MSRRKHVVEVEVPGTPDEVWQAIATGPGITAWFVPSEVDGRVGGEVVTHLSSDSGADSRGEITAYEPPRRFAYVERWDDVDFATEFLVEARAGGTCVVRIVSSGFGETEEWDRQMEGLDQGWRSFLDNLRLYLTLWRGEPCAPVLADAIGDGEPDAALRDLLEALGIPAEPVVGATVTAAGDAPALDGVVERVTPTDVAIRIHAPARGIVVASAFAWDEGTMVRLHGYLYGASAATLAARLAPTWRAWLAARFAPSELT